MRKIMNLLFAVTILFGLYVTPLHAENELEITGVELTTLPRWQYYLQGVDEYNPDCGNLTISYSDGSTKNVKLVAAIENGDAIVEGFDNSIIGTQTLTITYKGHTTSYNVNIYGHGDNAGNVEIEGVTRLYGKNRFQTSVKIAWEYKRLSNVHELSNGVVVANGYNFADALSGAYLANKVNGPLIIIPKGPYVDHADDFNSYYTAAYFVHYNLKLKSKQYFLGGENVIENGWAAYPTCYENQQLAGPTRYDTNLEILKEAGIENEPILIATGKNYADSLSASATGLPVLLVDGKLSDNQKELLASLNGNKMYILGGTSAVSSTIESELKIFGEVERIAGKNRYETSILIAETFFDNPKYAVLAYGNNFPDGLSGGALAYKIGGPLLLVDKNNVNIIANYTRKYNINDGYVLGGETFVTKEAVKKIFNQSEYASDGSDVKKIEPEIVTREDAIGKWTIPNLIEGLHLFESKEEAKEFYKLVTKDEESKFYCPSDFGYAAVIGDIGNKCPTGFYTLNLLYNSRNPNIASYSFEITEKDYVEEMERINNKN